MLQICMALEGGGRGYNRNMVFGINESYWVYKYFSVMEISDLATHIWQLSPQLCYDDMYQIWTWYSIRNQYFNYSKILIKKTTNRRKLVYQKPPLMCRYQSGVGMGVRALKFSFLNKLQIFHWMSQTLLKWNIKKYLSNSKQISYLTCILKDTSFMHC